MRKLVAGCVPIVLVLAGRAGGAHEVVAPLDIALTVTEPTGVARKGAPVTSGVCLPKGRFRDPAAFRLLDGEQDVPLQVTPLVVERDGSLRWILLDFQLDAGARETRRLVLRAGRGEGDAPLQEAGRSASRQIRVEDADDGIAIDTGALELRVGRSGPFAPLGKVVASGVPVVSGSILDCVEAKAGTRYVAGRPTAMSLEYRGPLRVTLRADGPFRLPDARDGDPAGEAPGLRYTTRITAWAGSTVLRVEHILSNSDSAQVRHWNIRDASLELRHGLGSEGEAIAGAEGARAPLSPGARLWLHQGKVNRYYGEPIADATRAGDGERVLWTGADSGGWIEVRTGTGALRVCDRDFQGDPPRRLEADGERIVVKYVAGKFPGEKGEPFLSDRAWLYDLSHEVLDAWIDVAPRGGADELAAAARSRLLALASPEWYSECGALGTGRFGTLADEMASYRAWGWRFEDGQVPRSPHDPHAFVRWEDNHYESEADSTEGLILMALRTGERGCFDRAEAWARYHANLHAWRSDGWVYDDGAIWFPQGGPLGTRPARKQPERDYEKWGKGTGDDKELWRLVQAKACYCHFYGAGLVDHFCLTGQRDSLEAALDLVEQKDSEFRKHRQLVAGAHGIDDTRGFGRGFYVIVRVAEAVPGNSFVEDLARLCRDVLWRAPDLDERGFAPCHIGTGFGGFDLERDLNPGMRQAMEREGIRIDEKGWLSDARGKRWPVLCIGGTWQHAYVQAAAYRYHEVTGDEDMADFAEAFGRFAGRFLLSEKCGQTHYYAYMDVPRKGEAWDPWKYDPAHLSTTDGEGCVHSGWYTCFFPDAMAMGYSLTGDRALLERAREFWHRGSKRPYETKAMAAGRDAVHEFASHRPPKDDTVLSTARMFHEWAHPRGDAEPPDAVRDLEVTARGPGEVLVRFTAPADRGGGRVARYQVKCAALPIVAWDEFDFARDDGLRRNLWKAENLAGEPAPRAPGTREEFVMSGVPAVETLHFVVVSHDDSANRSGLSNVAALPSSR